MGKNEKGQLKIFFSYAESIGKTLAMLKAAKRVRDQGADVVVGCIGPHMSDEVLVLFESFERLVQSPGEEFDLEAEITPSTHQAELSWSSSDREVVTVEDGHIVALKEGEATITVRIKGSMRQVASCDVTVMAPE